MSRRTMQQPTAYAVGPYPVTATIGSGSFGTVYLGQHPVSGDRVAIKLLRDNTTGARLDLHLEAGALRSVSDPHCIRVWDVLDEPTYAALVTDYVDGASLRAVLRAHGRLDAASAIGVLHGALSGLVAVHRAGLVHGDVKPDNVLLDRSGVSRLIDFGLASASGSAGSGSGSPAYMAPEQIQGAPLDHRSDLFAFSVMLYELLTGQRPFRAASLAELHHQHLHAEPPDPRHVDPAISPTLAWLCLAGLAKSPAERPATAADYLRHLEAGAAEQCGALWLATTAAAGTGLGLLAGGLAAAPVPIAAAAGGGAAVAGTAVGAAASGGAATTGGVSVGTTVAAGATAVALAVGGVVGYHALRDDPAGTTATAGQASAIRAVDLSTLPWTDGFTGAALRQGETTPGGGTITLSDAAAYADVDGDGDLDAIASVTETHEAETHGPPTVWYVWTWDERAREAVQVTYPISAVGCGGHTEATAGDGVFRLAETIVWACPSGSMDVTRTVRIEGGYPVSGDAAGGWGGYCPQETVEAGLYSTSDGTRFFSAPDTSSRTAQPSAAGTASGWFAADPDQYQWASRPGWQLVQFGTGREGDHRSCAWASTDAAADAAVWEGPHPWRLGADLEAVGAREGVAVTGPGALADRASTTGRCDAGSAASADGVTASHEGDTGSAVIDTVTVTSPAVAGPAGVRAGMPYAEAVAALEEAGASVSTQAPAEAPDGPETLTWAVGPNDRVVFFTLPLDAAGNPAPARPLTQWRLYADEDQLGRAMMSPGC